MAINALHLCSIPYQFLIFSTSGSERRTKYGCEGSSLEIECEEGEQINLVRANYGRFSISICNKEGNTAWSVNCMEPRTLRVINKQCGKESRCTVAVSSALFGDPCPGTNFAHLCVVFDI